MTPLKANITITKKIVEAGKLFDIVVLDHLIIGAGYYSLADNVEKTIKLTPQERSKLTPLQMMPL
jgi:hypothetical protein